MATARDICTAALRRLRVIGFAETAPAEDMDLAVGALNRMLWGWARHGVRLEHQEMTANSTFIMWVPHRDTSAEAIDAVELQGTWNAITNTPTLTSSVGTNGDLYRVATAGPTTLDDVSPWSENDFLIYDGKAGIWRKCRSETDHRDAVIWLLAATLVDDYGKEPTRTLAAAANSAWKQILADYVRSPDAVFDDAILTIGINNRSRVVLDDQSDTLPATSTSGIEW